MPPYGAYGAADMTTALATEPILAGAPEARAAGGSALIETVALALAGAAASMIATGFVAGIGNNLFHLPILAALYDRPQFADDAFIQSLRAFSAGPWLLLAGAGTWLDPAWALALLGFVARFVTFLGFLACAETLGLRRRGERALFVGLIVNVGLMSGLSYAGGAGLFINCGTHSELANGVALLAFAAAARGRFAGAATLAGAAFFTNAFMGVWTLAAIAAAAVAAFARRDLDRAKLIRDIGVGAVGFAVWAAPVAVAIVANPEFGGRPPVDYRVYLAGYWGAHFLISSLKWVDVVMLAMIAALGAAAFRAAGPQGRAYLAIMAALAAIYLAGAAAPAVTGSPAILNLHLLRVGGFLQMLSVLAAATLATRKIFEVLSDDPGSWRRRAAAAVAGASLCWPPAGAALAALACATVAAGRARLARFDRMAAGFGLGSAAGAGLWLALVAAFAAQTATSSTQNAKIRAAAAEWAVLADWARASTPVETSFMIPIADLEDWQAPDLERRDRLTFLDAGAAFESRAERRIWVDFKRGAAVMWRPSYFTEWRGRVDDVFALTTLDQSLSYASRHAVDYVVAFCGDAGPAPVFRTATLCVHAAGAAGPWRLRG